MGQLIKDYNTVISSAFLVCLFLLNLAFGSSDMFWFHPYTIIVWVLILCSKYIKHLNLRKSVLIILWPYFIVSTSSSFLFAVGAVNPDYAFFDQVEMVLNVTLAMSVMISLVYLYKVKGLGVLFSGYKWHEKLAIGIFSILMLVYLIADNVYFSPVFICSFILILLKSYIVNKNFRFFIGIMAWVPYLMSTIAFTLQLVASFYITPTGKVIELDQFAAWSAYPGAWFLISLCFMAIALSCFYALVKGNPKFTFEKFLQIIVCGVSFICMHYLIVYLILPLVMIVPANFNLYNVMVEGDISSEIEKRGFIKLIDKNVRPRRL